ncbi:MAG: diaminopimelate epimerase [Clostridia bacterium]|nr:diaminopimelate epimerase [Clostridia bacterium]
MHFTKMQGLGNDYLYVYGEVPENIEALCIALSDRHFGAGSDGMIYIAPSEVADFSMRIFNADGSEAKMCGNGIRCVGKYVYEKGYTDKTNLEIQTRSGIKHLQLHLAFGKVQRVDVAMGKAEVEKEQSLTIAENEVTYTAVNVGNPHAVIFCEDAEKAPVASLGKAMEESPAFEGGVNVEFVSPAGNNTVRMRVWERGSGITMACGTGACASAAAAVKKGLCAAEQPIEVKLDGGSLFITVHSDDTITMSGPAAFVYEGETRLC